MTSVPYGATADDTAEFMLGDVVVSVVLFESDGSRDANLEDWSPGQIDQVKQNVQEGLRWWEELLEEQGTSHWLNFTIDFTYTDQPIETGYEAISRPSDDFVLWMDDFFQAAEIPSGASFSDRIRQFNHQQRLEHEANWAFTIFVVNAENDPDSRFDSSGSFSRAFAFAGGRFFVTTSERPASTIAHETGHMFWALDEYADGGSYSDHRGYYDTQNLNAIDGHPNPAERVRSIMDSHGIAFATHAASPSSLEMIGWRDSDQDGIFDLLDVPHRLEGVGDFDADASRYTFTGTTSVDTLPNRNPAGRGHDITLNEISRIEIRWDDGPWQTLEEIGAYQADLEYDLAVPELATEIAIRSLDDRTGISSPIFTDQLERPAASWQNPANALDVNGDQVVAPLDALLVINELNTVGPHSLLGVPVPAVPQYLDVNGDQFVSAIDALLVINWLNADHPPILSAAAAPSEGLVADAEGESDVSAAIVSLNVARFEHDRVRSVELSPTIDRTARCVDVAFELSLGATHSDRRTLIDEAVDTELSLLDIGKIDVPDEK